MSENQTNDQQTGDAEIKNTETPEVKTKKELTPEEKEAKLGRLRRATSKLEKELGVKEEKQESEPKGSSEEKSDLLEKAFLRASGITDKEEVELALKTAKKWDMDVDELVDDDDFQAKLEKHRTQKANRDATSDVKGDKSGDSAKNSPDYWIAKGVPPTREQVPDRATRAKIARAMMKNAGTSGKTFYND